MSITCQQWIYRFSDATGTARLVLLVIGDFADNDGLNAFPKMDTIALHSRCARSTVQETISRLERAGELLVRRGGGSGVGNSYAVVMGRDPDALARSLGWPSPKKGPDAGRFEEAAPVDEEPADERASESQEEASHATTGAVDDEEKGPGSRALSEPETARKGPENSPDQAPKRARKGPGLSVTKEEQLLTKNHDHAAEVAGDPQADDPQRADGRGDEHESHGALARLAAALDRGRRESLWREGARGRAALAARLDELVGWGWEVGELLDELLSGGWPPGVTSVVAVLLERARALSTEPTRLAAERLAAEEERRRYDARLRSAESRAHNLLAIVPPWSVAEIVEDLEYQFAGEPELLAVAMTVVELEDEVRRAARPPPEPVEATAGPRSRAHGPDPTSEEPG